MVTGIREASLLTTQAIEPWPITLPELGAMVGVPIKMKPWWGSLRAPDPLIHSVCGHHLVIRHMEEGLSCLYCRRKVGLQEVKTKRGPRNWVCPGGYNYAQVTPPQIQNGAVVIWEGKCGMRAHKHSQAVEVLSVAQGAILLRITVSTHIPHYLIGVDDDHPYVTQVHKKPATVEEAFDWLVPKMVKRAIADGLEVRRQGDWHFIPTEKEPRSDLQNDPLYFRSRDGHYIQRFRTHFVYRNMQLIYGEETRHRGQYVDYQTIFGLAHTAPLVKGKVTAPNHPPLHLPGWHIGVRNRSSNGGAVIRGGD